MTRSQRLTFLTGRARLTLSIGAAQGVVQLLGFVSGVLIVRLLPPEQYAYYTLAIAGAATLQNIADGGVINGVLAQGGQVWRERARLGSVLGSALRLRHRLTAVVLIPALPVLWLLLRHQGAAPLQAAVVSLSMLPMFVLGMSTSFWETVPKLHQELRPLQLNQLIANFARAMIVVCFATTWPVAAVAVLAPALPQWWVNRRMRRLAAGYADRTAADDPELTRSLLAHVRRSLPIATYYALSSQITIWLIALFGHTTGVASVGALGRIAMIQTVLLTTFSLLAVPRFARIQGEHRQLLWSRYWQAQVLLLAACAIPLGAVAIAPTPVLHLLGPNYAGLVHELRLVLCCGTVSTLAGAAFGLSAARGVVAPPWAVIPAGILVQALLICLLPIDTIAGVLWLGLLNATFEWLLYVGYFRLRVRAVAG